jgi:hypothetical protein
MPIDIVEIGLDSMTDDVGFEKLAAELMRGEGYYDIKPLGGVGDLGQDAVQDRFYHREGRVRIVFQFTLEDYIAGKLRKTVEKLEQNRIQFAELVIVTPVRLSSERHYDLTKIAREEFDVTLQVYDRKTLVNRLSDFSNGIFHRHFQDIDRQIQAARAGQPTFQNMGGQLETAMLKVSIALVLGRGVDPVRKLIFDHLILATLVGSPSQKMTLSDISTNVADGLGCKPFPESQVFAALRRLEGQELITFKGDHYSLAKTTINAIEGATIQANNLSASVISDIVEEVCEVSGRPISSEERNKLERNARDVLAVLFRLMGLELANQFLEKATPSPLYLESSDCLLALAKQQVDETLGEMLVTALADAIQNPSAEQSQMLASWARAYLGQAIMNLDPSLQELQQTRLRSKVFILDTDFVLRCIVDELPGSKARLALVQKLADIGCNLIIPEEVVSECAVHARQSPRCLRYFGMSLAGLTPALVEREVKNLFVQGFFYGKRDRLFPAGWTFNDYLGNYYDSTDPTRFAREVITIRFPSTVKIVDPATMLSADLPRDLVERVSIDLLRVRERSLKYEWRTKEESEQLAQTDARLFVTALKINEKEITFSGNCILAGTCYIVTDSAQYLRSAKALGIRDVISTRPQKLLALIEVATGSMVDDVSFVRLFENPLLIYAVSRLWDDVRVLLHSGIGLTGKKLVRLRWDLDKTLHNRISALQIADERAEAEGEGAAADAGDSEYIDLFREATALGYSLHPALMSLQQALERVKDQAEIEKTTKEHIQKQLDLLAPEIERFGKRKQRYLKKIARQESQGDKKIR